MRILHSEASPGWGGQEIRILEEAIGMKERGHEIFFAVQKGGDLVLPARAAGFVVYEIDFKKWKSLSILFSMARILLKHKIDILNTHSSLDAWLGAIAARITRRPIIRTRHLSTPIRKGCNSILLYNFLADIVVTTCQEVVPIIQNQAALPPHRCLSIPTGIDTTKIQVDSKEVEKFRSALGLKPTDFLCGTLCILRGWKGIVDLLEAAKILVDKPHIKWVVIGSGPSEEYFLKERARLKLEERVIFTGFLSPPFHALAALDAFLLLSHAHEGVSQATLQAGFLEKPFITTPIGGLKEVCIPGFSGLHVAPHAPSQVAEQVVKLSLNGHLREELGKNAKKLVLEKFTSLKTLDAMEKLYYHLSSFKKS